MRIGRKSDPSVINSKEGFDRRSLVNLALRITESELLTSEVETKESDCPYLLASITDSERYQNIRSHPLRSQKIVGPACLESIPKRVSVRSYMVY